MAEGLPLQKIVAYYKDTNNAAKQSILDRYSFCEYMKNEVGISPTVCMCISSNYMQNYETNDRTIHTLLLTGDDFIQAVNDILENSIRDPILVL